MEFSDSLKKNTDFQRVYKAGTSVANRYLVMYVLRNGGTQNRLGISVSKKVGNSVVRHRITRLIRESYRLNEQRFTPGVDMVVIARPSAKGVPFHELERCFLLLGRKAKICRYRDGED